MRRICTLFCSAMLAATSLPGFATDAVVPLSYAGKTVLVTGSTDGLGRELARALAAEGAPDATDFAVTVTRSPSMWTENSVGPSGVDTSSPQPQPQLCSATLYF